MGDPERDARLVLGRRRFLDTAAAIEHGRRLAGEGPASWTSAANRRGPAPSRSRSRGAAPRLPSSRRSRAAAGGDLDRHQKGRGRAARARGRGDLVNDVTALRGDPRMVEVVATRGRVLPDAHAGKPRTMQDDPRYGDVVDDVAGFLAARIAFAQEHGIEAERLLIDPGIGFGKTVRHNLELLAGLPRIAALGRPCSSAPRARASSEPSLQDPTGRCRHRTDGSPARSLQRARIRARGPRYSESTTSQRCAKRW